MRTPPAFGHFRQANFRPLRALVSRSRSRGRASAVCAANSSIMLRRARCQATEIDIPELQYPARQRDGNRTSAAQRGGIEVGRNCCGIGEGPPDAPEQIDNQTRRDGELTIGEMLYENGAEECVVGSFDLDCGGSAQA